MTNPTSNFGWQMPTSTDLVTDLPADFEVFGQAVDTDFVDLLGGTTGQVLSKTSNTDLDFTWVAANPGDITGVTAGTGISGGGTSGTVTVTNDMATTITAAGDIVVGTGSGTYDNLPIGTTAQVLTADTTVSPYKVKWATPSGGTPFTTDISVNSITVGRGAGNSATNTVFGNGAFASNTVNTNNVAIGVSALAVSTVDNNTAVGHEALLSNTTGPQNVAVGKNAMRANTTGGYGTAVGLNALTANTTGNQNTAVGRSALEANTTGTENTAVGHNALKTSTANTSSTAIGWGSLELATNADKNTAVGKDSLYTLTSGTRNVGIGSRTGISLTTASTNTIIGEAAGQTLVSGINNTVIGASSSTAAAGSNHTVTLGDSSITTLRCQVTSITALSDARDKKNIEPLEIGLDFIKDLKPVKFVWDMRPTVDVDGNKHIGKVDVADVGFIAQDLVAQEDASGLADYLQLTYRDNPEKLEATQGRLIPILVKAIQELSAKVAALETAL